MEKLNKMIITMVIIIVILLSIISALIIYQPSKIEEGEGKNIEGEISEVILDDCTDEYEKINEEIVTTNANQEKISPGCTITLNKYYKGCNDTINEYVNVSQDLINCTKTELQDKYKDWQVKEFSKEKVVLYKQFEGNCGEHYILKNKDGKIIVNKLFENGKETEYEKTDIDVEYLPEKDRNLINEGLKINGKERLNELIESFE